MNFSLLKSGTPSYAEIFESALKRKDFKVALEAAVSHLTSVEIKNTLAGDYPVNFKKKVLNIFIQRPIKNTSGYNDFVSNSLEFLPDLWKKIIEGDNYLKEPLAEFHKKLLFLAKRDKTKALLHSFLDMFDEYHPQIEEESRPEEFGLGKDVKNIIKCGRHPYLLSFFLQEQKNTSMQASAQILT